MTQQKNREEYRGIWVVAEQTATGISGVSFELLSKARELKAQAGIKEPVTAVILGEELSECAARFAEAGAEKVILVDHPALKYFQNETYAAVLKALVDQKKPSVLLMGATASGSDLAPTLGVKLWTGVAAHCIDMRIDEAGNLIAVVPAFGGKVLGDILCPDFRPQMATVRPGILGKAVCFTNTDCSVEHFNPSGIIAQDKGRVQAVGITHEEIKGMPLETAEVVVAGGFGMESKGNWQLLEDLAAALGGAVGCTRPPIDEGWSHEFQMIGTSGKSIRPKVYIGAGISGATHHVCGMKDSGLVISINKDEKAPIFDVSDIRIVSDAAVILPLLIEAINAKEGYIIC